MGDNALKVTIHTFADLREALGESIVLQVSEPVCVADLQVAMKEYAPDQSDRINSCRFAINRKMANWDSTVHPSDEIFLFPPPSGG